MSMGDHCGPGSSSSSNSMTTTLNSFDILLIVGVLIFVLVIGLIAINLILLNHKTENLAYQSTPDRPTQSIKEQKVSQSQLDYQLYRSQESRISERVGKQLTEEINYCYNCGHRILIKKGSNYCSYCGNDI